MVDNENNHADFESDLHDTIPVLKPARDMTRQEFIDKARDLLADMESDHEEQTGVEENEPHDWEFWTNELINAYLNS